MLEKIEAAYLAAMRVIVLVAATVALLVVIGGAISAAPMLAEQLGFTSGPKPITGADLNTFVAEQRAAAAETPNGSEAPEVTVVPGKLAKSAELISQYARRHWNEPVVVRDLQMLLLEERNKFDYEFQSQFEDSIYKLATDLNAATGRPLSMNRVGALLEWHSARFLEQAQAQKFEREAARARAQASLIAAGGALFAFIVILFFFLFVKIERNLRLVRTREVAP